MAGPLTKGEIIHGLQFHRDLLSIVFDFAFPDLECAILCSYTGSHNKLVSYVLARRKAALDFNQAVLLCAKEGWSGGLRHFRKFICEDAQRIINIATTVIVYGYDNILPLLIGWGWNDYREALVAAASVGNISLIGRLDRWSREKRSKYMLKLEGKVITRAALAAAKNGHVSVFDYWFFGELGHRTLGDAFIAAADGGSAKAMRYIITRVTNVHDGLIKNLSSCRSSDMHKYYENEIDSLRQTWNVQIPRIVRAKLSRVPNPQIEEVMKVLPVY